MMINKIKTIINLIKTGKFDLLRYKFLRRIGFKNILSPLPISLVIEPANFCNLRCPICPTGSGRIKRPKRLMSFGEFKKIIDEVRGYTTKIVLFNYGEPFLNKEVLEMIKYAIGAKMNVKISTNGELLKSKELCERIVKSSLQHLIVSLDGLDQETLSQYRIGATFDNIIDGIKNIVEAKKKFNSKKPKIELQFLVMKHNEHQKKAAEKLAEELGVDIFVLKTIYLYDASNLQEEAKRFLPKDQSFSRYDLLPDGTYILKGKPVNRCKLVSGSAVINSDGSVVPCCYDLDSNYIMGNIFQESLRSIWHNRRYDNFRKQIQKDRAKIHMCDTCPEERIEFLSEKKNLT